MSRPHFGHTRAGLPVHLRTADHLTGSRFNKSIALLLQKRVMSMGCFWVFCGLALLSLPATLHLAGFAFVNHIGIPKFFLHYGFIFLDAWVCQNFIQLVLLPALGVGQNLQSAASDARAAKQFEDTELIVDRLDTSTQGGLKTVLDAVTRLGEETGALADATRAVLAGFRERQAPAEAVHSPVPQPPAAVRPRAVRLAGARTAVPKLRDPKEST